MKHYLFAVDIEDDDDWGEQESWMLEVDADTLDEAFDKAKAKAASDGDQAARPTGTDQETAVAEMP